MASENSELVERFGSAMANSFGNESYAILKESQHRKQEEELRMRAERLLGMTNDNPFVALGASLGKHAGKIVSPAAETIELAGDDLYTAYHKWSDSPEKVGELAGKLQAHANWELAHGKTELALSKYKREVRLLKSYGLDTHWQEKTIEAIEFPSNHSFSVDLQTELDRLASK